MVAANDHLEFHGKKMSEAASGPDMDPYTQLTDEVFQKILHSPDKRMQAVQCNIYFLFRSLLAHSIDMHIITIVFFFLHYRLLIS